MKTSQKKDILQKVRTGEPIEICGLTLYPIRVSQYDDFMTCKDGLLIRQGALPARLAAMDYLSALFTADTDETCAHLKTGAFAKAIRFLLLALRMEATEQTLEQMLWFSKRGEKTVLSKIEIEQNAKKAEITPSDFSGKIRPILCLQNALELPDESMNIDLLRAAEEKRALQNKNVKLDPDPDDMIATVAYLCGKRIAEVQDFTIWEFERIRRAIEREKLFTIYKTGEMSGMVTFKSGNPVPSLFFDSVDDTLGTQSLSEVGKMFGNDRDGGIPKTN